MRPYLEIGGRHRISDEWDILGVEGGDIIHDINEPLPIEDNRYEIVYMSHVLEHVPWYNTVKVLKEVHRILKVGGCVEIFVPDTIKIFKAYLEGHTGKDKWRKHNKESDLDLWLNGRVFAYGPEPNWHKALFSPQHLEKCLKKAGFSEIEEITKQRSDDHGWINLGRRAVK